ncbi:MAG: YidC/Oxa1 family membrane protein insertase, partial [Patescibacteria group bacterium]
MNIFTLVFQEILYRPLLNLLVFFYQLPLIDFGSAILLLTVFTRLLLWPLNSKMIKGQNESQSKSAQIKERIDEIKTKYKDDPPRQNEEVMKLWKEMKFN